MNTTYGFLCLVPPIVAIALAVMTKQTILSLFVATWLGSTIVNGWNPFVGFAKIISDYAIPQVNSNGSMIILVTLAGGLIAILKATGAAHSFALKVTKVINTAKKGQIMTCLSAFIFCYTEPCLMLGTIMQPVTDMVRVSRAKLAYILDSMGCNLASFSPISSYGPFITGLIAAELASAGLAGGGEWGIWLNMLPFNMYSLFAMITVVVVASAKLNFGPMREEEERAEKTGVLMAPGVEPLVPEFKLELPETYNLGIKNFVVPMVFLFGSLFATIFWTGNIAENGLVGAFRSANITLAICMAFMGGGVGAGLVGSLSGLFSPSKGFNTFVDGMAKNVMIPFILVGAWSLGSIVKQMETGAYLVAIVKTYMTPALVPAMIFLFGAAISFATGSSWGVWSIMMPIAFPMAIAFDIPIPFVVGAVISGGMFGDQCSPISDTTIMSSTGASCNHIVHVMTQLPYGLSVGFAAFCGFLFGGVTGQWVLSIVATACVLYPIMFLMTKFSSMSRSTPPEAAAD